MRWKKNSSDADLVREEIIKGRFYPKSPNFKDLWESRSTFRKYNLENFRKKMKNILPEFTWEGRVVNHENKNDEDLDPE